MIYPQWMSCQAMNEEGAIEVDGTRVIEQCPLLRWHRGPHLFTPVVFDD